MADLKEILGNQYICQTKSVRTAAPKMCMWGNGGVSKRRGIGRRREGRKSDQKSQYGRIGKRGRAEATGS